ncbi:murein biosynthesis integral membrane protein MurJ, partial [endosymbiont of Ridgeia piscesae]
RVTVLLGVPAAVGLFVLAGPTLATLFHSEAFTAQDVLMSSYSLMAYAPGLMAIMLIKILAPGFYARQDTRTPVRIGILAMAANMLFNLLLVFPLDHAGLALATTISSSLNAWLLYRGLREQSIYTPRPGWPGIWLRASMAAFAMGALLLWGVGSLDLWLGQGTWTRIVHLTFFIASGGVLYFVVLYISGIRLHHFRSL